MKVLLITSLCFISFNTFSKEKSWHNMEKKYDKMPIEEAKKLKLEMLDMRSGMMDKERSCITASQDKTAFNECTKEMKKNEKEMEAEMDKKMKTKM